MDRRVAQVLRALARGVRRIYDCLPVPLDARLRHRQWIAQRMPGLLVAGGSPQESVRAGPASALPILIIPIDGDSGLCFAEQAAGTLRRVECRIVVPPCPAPLVSIVVPAHNNWRYTRACIASVVSAEPGLGFEIILADDASTDETREAERHVPGLVVCRQASNVGFLRNVNAAARLARGRYLVLLNNDTQVQPGALSQMLRVFAIRPDAGLVGAKLVYPDGKLQEAGGIVWQDGSCANHGWGSDPTLPEFSYLKEADYCSGACIMVQRELWEQLGGFDETYSPAYYEDTDLAFRVREAGRVVYFQPAATILHFEGRSHGVDLRAGLKAKQVEHQSVFCAKWKGVLDRDHAKRGVDVFHARDRSLNRPCILIVDHYVPQPDRDAGSRSMWCIIRVLLEMGLNVKFWPHNRCRDPAYAAKLEALGVEVLGCAGAAGTFSAWMSRHGHDVDAVLLSRPHVAADCIDDIRRHSRARVNYYGHDLHHERMRAQAEVTGDARMRTRADSMRLLEESLWRRADLVYYPSFLETDEVMRSCPGVVARTLPAYFFEALRHPQPGPQERQGIIFVAGFAHPPNVDAAQWLVHEIMPLVRGRMPGVKLWLAGSSPTAEVRALASTDVTVTGNLSDEELDALYRRIRVAVVPLRFGAGVKHKVLEAMHHGVPLVTTSVGMQGLPELDRVVPVEEGAGALSSAIVELLTDDQHWASTARHGREYVQSRYSRQAMHSVIAQDFSSRVSRPVLRS